MGAKRSAAQAAFDSALAQQIACEQEMKTIGRQVMANLESHPDQMAVVLFGRPYNAFAGETNMGIPHKIASRNMLVIPFDFLHFENEPVKHHMYWGMGQQILKTCHLVAKHPQLYGIYITNFSCGPDSFIIGYFRAIMGKKPSLTLELDNHTADEVVVFFMPSGTGPCRFGQYSIFMEDLVKSLKLADVALFSLNEESAYADLGNDFHKKGWWAVVVSDVLEDIRSMLLANARNPLKAIELFNSEVQDTLTALERGSFPLLEKQLFTDCRMALLYRLSGRTRKPGTRQVTAAKNKDATQAPGHA